jgi:hypothetical protein
VKVKDDATVLSPKNVELNQRQVTEITNSKEEAFNLELSPRERSNLTNGDEEEPLEHK